MVKLKYTIERNAQIVISLLKQYGIKHIIASPGTTNKVFVWSVQQDPFFKIYSSVDERSAAYLACGLAEQTGKPVVISCTGATASRNYLPGLTEAYYRKLPVIALTSHQGVHRIGNLYAQNIDRRVEPNDVAFLNVDAVTINTPEDETYCILEVNKALQCCTERGGGPVHINLFTQYSQDFSAEVIKPARMIKKITVNSSLPEIKNISVAFFIGYHKKFEELEIQVIEKFCKIYGAVVFCDSTSGYYGKYKVKNALVFSQEYYKSKYINVDLLIHIGEISGDYYTLKLRAKEVWRVSPDGLIKDPWKKLTNVFEMDILTFCGLYNTIKQNRHNPYEDIITEYNNILRKIPDIPFSNIWVAKELSKKLPTNSVVHLGILNSLRAWNFFYENEGVETCSNVGGFGIDGGVSTLIGASFANPGKLYYGIFGDLAFFYDMNVLGNRHVGNNLRIIIINNGRGTEFRNYSHDCYIFGEKADDYLAAAGHFGNKSTSLVKHYAEDLGYKYFTASTKQEFNDCIDDFLAFRGSSVVFELFTRSEDESEALKRIINIEYDASFAFSKKIHKNIHEIKKTILNKLK